MIYKSCLLIANLLLNSKADPNTINYKDGLYVAAGFESSDASILGSPFNPSSIRLKEAEVSMKGNIKMDIVQNEEEMANILTNKSPLEFSAFGISAKVDLTFDK